MMAVLFAAALGSASVFAADHTDAINAAGADATTNYTAVVTVLITVAAVGFCIGMILSKVVKGNASEGINWFY